MQFEGDNLVYDVSHPTNDTKDPLAVKVDAEDDWDLQYILPSNVD